MLPLKKLTVAFCVAMSSFQAATPGWASNVEEVAPDVERLRRLVIQSEILGEARPVDIYLPKSYGATAEAHPVIYVLDGEESFHYAAGVLDALYQRGYPKMILAAIPNRNRSLDLTPEAWGSDALSGGGADNFAAFFAEELIPAVDARFRTQQYRVLVGHSFGGLFASHVLATRPDIFDSYIAISPSMDFADHRPLKTLEKSFANDAARPKSLFVAMGNEPGGEGDSVHQLYSMLAVGAPSWLDWAFHRFPDEDHSSVPVIAMLQGLRFVFQDFVIEGRDIPATARSLEQHYQEVSERFAWVVKPPQRVLMNLGYGQLERGEADAAVDTFKLYAKLYPDQIAGWDGLSAAYQLQGDEKASIAALRKVIEIAPWYDEARLKLEALEQNIKD
ncbi:MAG: alpha/beta hydrolase-fold protein [Pseudomonadota bacterium]